MVRKIARLQLSKQSLKRIISDLVKANPFSKGRCKYCGGVNSHSEDCIYQTAEKVTSDVRENKRPK